MDPVTVTATVAVLLAIAALAAAWVVHTRATNAVRDITAQRHQDSERTEPQLTQIHRDLETLRAAQESLVATLQEQIAADIADASERIRQRTDAVADDVQRSHAASINEALAALQRLTDEQLQSHERRVEESLAAWRNSTAGEVAQMLDGQMALVRTELSAFGVQDT